MSAFAELGLCPELIASINDSGWNLPTDIQAESIPLVLGGGDICAAAETGSGKTGAFALPAVQIVTETLKSSDNKGSSTTVVDADQFTNNSSLGGLVLTSDGGHTVITKPNPVQWRGVQAKEGGDCSTSWMYEVEITNLDAAAKSVCRLGFSLLGASIDDLGTDIISWGYGGTGKKVHKGFRGVYIPYGETYTKGDVIGCYICKDGPYIGFTKNGVDLGKMADISSEHKHDLFRPTICGKGIFTLKIRYHDFLHPRSNTSPVPPTVMVIRAPSKDGTLCLIMEPTQDLARQTYTYVKDIIRYIDNPPISVSLMSGDISKVKLDATILVGTTPSVMTSFNRKKLKLNLVLLILDEADDMAKDGRTDDIYKIQSANRIHPQTLFYSATLHSQEVLSAIERFCVQPTFIDLKGRPSIPETVHARIIEIDPLNPPKLPALPTPPTDGVHTNTDRSDIDKHSLKIKVLKPQIAIHIADTLKMDSVLVFCRTNVDCDNFEKYLNILGGGVKSNLEADSGKQSAYTCVVLAGRRAQNARIQALELFKQGRARFLVCTDVAARGLDINRLPYVIILTLPDDPAQFIHRIGRVGREGRLGLAVAISSTKPEKVWYHKCNSKGVNCTNRKLLEQGGCTIYYDEPKYLAAIESLIDSKLERRTLADLIQEVKDDEEVVEVARGRRTQQAEKVVFGTKKGEYSVDNIENGVAEEVKRMDKKAELMYLKSLIVARPYN